MKDDEKLWQAQFECQRQFFQQKLRGYWTSKQLIRVAVTQRLFGRNYESQMSAPSHQNSSHFSADEFSAFFTSKVDKIRASTSSASPSVIKTQLVITTPLSSFESVSVDEVTRLLWRTPAKHCSLDPVPTWLVKRASDALAPVLSEICVVSLGFSTTQEADVRC